MIVLNYLLRDILSPSLYRLLSIYFLLLGKFLCFYLFISSTFMWNSSNKTIQYKKKEDSVRVLSCTEIYVLVKELGQYRRFELLSTHLDFNGNLVFRFRLLQLLLSTELFGCNECLESSRINWLFDKLYITSVWPAILLSLARTTHALRSIWLLRRVIEGYL